MTVIIVGAQLGDEGKGGVVDLFGDAADVVVRYQGGDNAGHTVVRDGEEFKLSLVPSGVIRGKVGVLGNGCVVNLRTLFSEIDGLRERGLDPDVRVAERAHVILPYHRVLDAAEEVAKGDSDMAVGTTKRGIGPTYEDKAGRRGVRVGDLLDPAVLRERLAYAVPRKRALAEGVFGVDLASFDAPGGIDAEAAFDVDALVDEYAAIGERLVEEGMPVDAGTYLADRHADGDRIMFEGAQGTLLDIDHGNYPYVTSSNPTAGNAATGTGLAPTVVGRGEVVGIVKAYLSRVGAGPMPTELDGDIAAYIRDEGGEYGTVTGRPRRVGWLDLPMLRHAARVNGFTGIVINHLDTLAGLDEVRVGHAYELEVSERRSDGSEGERSESSGGEELSTVPPTTERWADCEAVYRSFDGWPEFDPAAVAAEGYDALPAAAREYVEYVEAELGVDAVALGVGPGREETVVRRNPFE